MQIKNNAIFSCRLLFFIVSFYIGLWTIRIPTIKDQLQTDYLGIGYIFVSFAFGSILIMIISNQIIKKFSSKITIAFSGIMQSLLWLAVPFINDLFLFIPFSFIFGISYGLFEVAINLQASNIEKKENKSMMSNFHAFFSLGLLAGSFCTSIFLEFNISFFYNTLLYVIILLPLNIYFVMNLIRDSVSEEKNQNNIFFIWPGIIFVLVIFVVSDSLLEGGIDSWAALYMQDEIKVNGFFIGIATISFNLFMVVGRFIGDYLKDFLGIYRFILCLFFLCLIGLIIIFFSNTLLFSIIGFSITGLGSSCIIPLAYSLSGKVKGIDPAVGISIISICAYGVFMIAPAGMGLIAKFIGISYVFSPMIFLFIFSLLIAIAFNRKLNL